MVFPSSFPLVDWNQDFVGQCESLIFKLEFQHLKINLTFEFHEIQSGSLPAYQAA